MSLISHIGLTLLLRSQIPNQLCQALNFKEEVIHTFEKFSSHLPGNIILKEIY